MRIILLNKTCKYHKFVFATEIIFSSTPKSNLKAPQAFWRGNQSDDNFWVSLQKYVTATLKHVTLSNSNFSYEVVDY